MEFIVNKYYQTFTPESSENGECADQGVVYENEHMDLRELVDEIKKGYFTELSQWPISDLQNSNKETYAWLSTPDPEQNYRTGEDTYYSLHIKTSNKNFYRICKLAGFTTK